mmetsp:Transcript_23825/g.34686  ORF Transcript_23825/g.34686 Transcript_23825/m.34686 type:complete len:80 (+) Transcript_23825:568-807(+)
MLHNPSAQIQPQQPLFYLLLIEYAAYLLPSGVTNAGFSELTCVYYNDSADLNFLGKKPHSSYHVKFVMFVLFTQQLSLN